jgi:sugar/nucleoside kinase (ribokinase family)
MNPLRIAFIDGCVVDSKVVQNTTLLDCGVDSLSFAIDLKRKLSPLSTEIYYLTAISRTNYETKMFQNLNKLGINTDLIQVLENKQPITRNPQDFYRSECKNLLVRHDKAAKFLFETNQLNQFKKDLFKLDVVFLCDSTLATLSASGRENLLSALTQFKSDKKKVIFCKDFDETRWSSMTMAQRWHKAFIQISDIVIVKIDHEKQISSTRSERRCIENVLVMGAQEVVIEKEQYVTKIYTSHVQFDMGTEIVKKETYDIVGTLNINTKSPPKIDGTFILHYIASRLMGQNVSHSVQDLMRVMQNSNI